MPALLRPERTAPADRRRIYTVPADWTGDPLLGQPARGVLGFASVATALEDPGFDRIGVVRLDVVLDGSGAIDDLGLCRLRSHAQAPHSPRQALGVFDGRMPR